MSDVSPFDFVKSIQKSKKDMIAEADDPAVMTKAYSPWMVNKALSMYVDSILYANEMNRAHFLDNDMQYAYHLNSVRAMSRKHTWFSKTSDKDLKLVQEHYKVNSTRASEIVKIIGSAGIETIKKKNAMGGVVKK
jgi:hypothetical protein